MASAVRARRVAQAAAQNSEQLPPSRPAGSAPAEKSADDGDSDEPPIPVTVLRAPLAHVLLAMLTVAPLFVDIPPNVNILLTATLTVYLGSRRSVRDEPKHKHEIMTLRDAMHFPFIGSLVLLSLFLAFKFLPKDWINLVLSFYFVVLGLWAVAATTLPFLSPLFPERMQKWRLGPPPFKLPFFAEPMDIAVTLPELAGAVLAAPLCWWYFAHRHWLANNILGLAFSLQGIEQLSLGSIKVGCILLGGLFVYDIFWVFCTPVMVSVATSFDGPIKLLFPRGRAVLAAAAAAKTAKSAAAAAVTAGAAVLDAAAPAAAVTSGLRPFSMLGLGDIVIPGIFVALMLRYDTAHSGAQRRQFGAALVGYALGLGTTVGVMTIFNAAQPALLYIVPGVLGCVAIQAWVDGCVGPLIAYDESVTAIDESDSGAAQDTAPS